MIELELLMPISLESRVFALKRFPPIIAKQQHNNSVHCSPIHPTHYQRLCKAIAHSLDLDSCWCVLSLTHSPIHPLTLSLSVISIMALTSDPTGFTTSAPISKSSRLTRVLGAARAAPRHRTTTKLALQPNGFMIVVVVAVMIFYHETVTRLFFSEVIAAGSFSGSRGVLQLDTLICEKRGKENESIGIAKGS